MAEAFQTERPKIVLFGSSLVQYSYTTLEGWGATLSHLYARKTDIALRGYAAWNSRRALGILDKVFPKISVVQPSLVIVHFGSEDSTRAHSSGKGPHVPLEEYVDNMKKIAQHLKGLPGTRLIFLSTPPVNDAKIPVDSDGKKPRTNETSKKYSDALLDLCQRMGILAIDLFTAIEEKDNNQGVCFRDDGVNLSEEGNIVVYEKILSALKTQHESWGLYWHKMISEFGEDSPYDPVAPDGESTRNAAYYAFPDPAKWGEPIPSTKIIPLHLL